MKNFDINKIKSLLSKPKKIVIVPHRNPDGDAMGSTLGLYHFLLKLNHEVVVISPNEFPDFLNWLPASEKVIIYEKQKVEATKAADESLKKVDGESRSKALKTAAVQQGGTGESTKPVYRRADLIRLRMQDPSRYESMAEEILQAYADGRVK